MTAVPSGDYLTHPDADRAQRRMKRNPLALILIIGSLGLGPARALADNLFVAALQNDIYEYATNGAQTVFANNANGPQNLAFDQSGNLFVASPGYESVAPAIYEYGPGGTRVTIGTSTFPFGVAVSPDGRAFVSDPDDGDVYIFPGKTIFASGLTPYGMTFDASGNLYVADQNTSAILKFTPGGGKSTFAQTNIFGQPSGMSFDRNGNLFVADPYAGVFKIAPNGAVARFNGGGFAQAQGLAMDSNGNLFVGDSFANYIIEYTNTASGPSTNRTPFASGVIASGLAFQPIVRLNLTISRAGTNSVTLSWPSPAIGWALEQKTALSNASWSSYTGQVSSNSQTLSATISPLQSAGYFRLAHP
jgi:sugar lactone lactonase YvrE